MNHYLTSAITSIIDAKGENIIDDKDEFMRIFTASTTGCEDTAQIIDLAISTGAVMIIAQAKNDDEEGQNNASRIAIEILIAEGVDKDTAIDVVTAFCVAYNFSFGNEKSEAQLIEDAKVHVSRKEFDSARKILNSLASKGSDEALYMLAVMYHNGIGVEVSYKKAISYLEKSKTPKAYSMLARMYLEGHGCTKNAAKSVELWNAGADMGDPECQYYLAMMYMKGIGTSPDMTKAVGYIKSAASMGFAPAVKALASLPKEHREKTEAEIAELEKADDPKSLYTLGNCYFKGDGVPQNKSKAIDCYTEAAKKGHFASQIALITRYTIDNDIPKAWSVAEHWYRKALATDKARLAIVHPGIVKGEEMFNSVPKTAKNKRERYEEAGRLGYIPAYTAIAKMYRGGEKALPWLALAADAGDIEALELILKRSDADTDKYQRIYDYVKGILKNCSN